MRVNPQKWEHVQASERDSGVSRKWRQSQTVGWTGQPCTNIEISRRFDNRGMLFFYKRDVNWRSIGFWSEQAREVARSRSQEYLACAKVQKHHTRAQVSAASFLFIVVRLTDVNTWKIHERSSRVNLYPMSEKPQNLKRNDHAIEKKKNETT